MFSFDSESTPLIERDQCRALRIPVWYLYPEYSCNLSRDRRSDKLGRSEVSVTTQSPQFSSKSQS